MRIIAAAVIFASASIGLAPLAASSEEEAENVIFYTSAFLGFSNVETQRAFGTGGIAFDLSKQSVISGHTAHETSECIGSVPLKFCITSTIFSFSVPMDLTKGQRWRVGTNSFVVSRVKQIWYRGALRTVYDIDCTRSGMDYRSWFVFNEEFGLIAFARWQPSIQRSPEDLIGSALSLDGSYGIGTQRH